MITGTAMIMGITIITTMISGCSVGKGAAQIRRGLHRTGAAPCPRVACKGVETADAWALGCAVPAARVGPLARAFAHPTPLHGESRP
jgi:hypothetical protein